MKFFARLLDVSTGATFNTSSVIDESIWLASSATTAVITPALSVMLVEILLGKTKNLLHQVIELYFRIL